MTAQSKVPGVFSLRSIDELDRIEFYQNMAALDVPIDLLRKLPIENDVRGADERLAAVERSIENKGYSALQPIVVLVDERGRWFVIDGGHRLTAARRVAASFWANLFGPKVRSLYFLLLRDRGQSSANP